eukprot:1156406-Pelagomonas_calceolata.AAC.6
MSPVFTSPVENEAPPVFVDRLGAKAWTSHTGWPACGPLCVEMGKSLRVPLGPSLPGFGQDPDSHYGPPLPVLQPQLLCRQSAGGQDNKVEHALIFQQVTTCDENGQTVDKVRAGSCSSTPEGAQWTEGAGRQRDKRRRLA